jgi:hypothetical protein
MAMESCGRGALARRWSEAVPSPIFPFIFLRNRFYETQPLAAIPVGILNFSIDALPAIWTHAVRFDDNRVEWHLPLRRYVLLAQAALLDELLKRSNIES